MLGKPFERARGRVFNTTLDLVSLQTSDSSLYLVFERIDATNLESSPSLDSYIQRICLVLNVDGGRQKVCDYRQTAFTMWH